MKPRALSGIQPSGKLTVGNYLGALANWKTMQDSFDCLFFIADLHALTIRPEPAELRERVRLLQAQYLACGLDPAKSILFVQSDIRQHTELTWLLSCFTMYGELSRMTQFKDKAAKRSGGEVSSGLFFYPVLQAADILIYRPDAVPVGRDQKQHIELARDIAMRVNGALGETLTVPEPYIPSAGARIMSLADPSRKMSKSDENLNASIYLDDSDEQIMSKCKRAVTDSDSSVRYDPENKPGVSNLIAIYAAAKGVSHSDVEREFEGKGYGIFKPALGELLCSLIGPIRREAERLLASPEELSGIYSKGAERASAIAGCTVSDMKKKLGLSYE